MADKLQSEQGEHARALRSAKGKRAFETEQKEEALAVSQERQDRA
jgi:hypothetical protein